MKDGGLQPTLQSGEAVAERWALTRDVGTQLRYASASERVGFALFQRFRSASSTRSARAHRETFASWY